jgi:5-methylcytosine-specific restriction endonuclease McrA
MVDDARKVREYIKNWKAGKECEFCGSRDNITAHHVVSIEKEFEVGRSNKSLEEVKKELEKCIPLCRSCHNKLHKREKNFCQL